LQEFGVRRSIRHLQSSPLQVTSLGWIGGFTGENGHSLQEAMREARRIIRVAGQVGARTVTVVTGPQAGHIRSHAFRIITEALQELSHLASTYEVQLALQPMHALFAKNWSFLHSLDDALSILDKAGDSRLKLAFGTYHLWEEPELLERVAEIAPRIGLVSLADRGGTPRDENDRLLPGDGILPLQEVVQTLEANGYSGWYELEVWSRDLWKLESRDLMRRCVAARDHLVSQPATC
jgi:sugar phosphate isomerase/epimerase